jgi:hypothetical protein
MAATFLDLSVPRMIADDSNGIESCQHVKLKIIRYSLLPVSLHLPQWHEEIDASCREYAQEEVQPENPSPIVL